MISSQTSPTSSVGATPFRPTPTAKQLGLPDLAFVGKAGAGKTTAAEMLVRMFNYRRLGFADSLKDTAERLWGTEARADRDKLQRLGVACREIDSEVWVQQLVKARAFYPGQMIVVDDCRFENEWFALQAEGFSVVRIHTKPSLRIDRLKASGKWQNEAQLEHVSETAVDHLKADHDIENSSTRTFLEDELLEVLIRERRRRS